VCFVFLKAPILAETKWFELHCPAGLDCLTDVWLSCSPVLRPEDGAGGEERLLVRDQQPEHQADPRRSALPAESHHETGLRAGGMGVPWSLRPPMYTESIRGGSKYQYGDISSPFFVRYTGTKYRCNILCLKESIIIFKKM
jgi:hypothetical protein